MQSKRALKFTLLLLGSHTIMAAAIIAPSLPDLAEVFKATRYADLLSKLVLSIPAVFIALSAPIAGRYIDRKGRLKLLYVGLIMYAISGSSGYFLNSLYHILLGRMLLGISIGIVMTVAITLIGDYFEGEERKKFIGLQSAFVGFAGVGFLAIGGFLGDISWRIPFLVYATVLLMLPLIHKFLPEPTAHLSHTQAPVQTNKLIRIIFITSIIYMILFYIIPTQLPFLLKEIGVEGTSRSGAALGINAFGVVISSLFYSRIRSNLPFPHIYAISFIVMALGFVITGSSESYLVILIAMFIAGLGFGLMIPNTNLWVIELTKPQFRGRNLGVLASYMFFGQFLSPLVVEPLVRVFHLSFLFSICGAIMVIMSLGFLAMRKFLTRMDRAYTLE